MDQTSESLLFTRIVECEMGIAVHMQSWSIVEILFGPVYGERYVHIDTHCRLYLKDQ